MIKAIRYRDAEGKSVTVHPISRGRRFKKPYGSIPAGLPVPASISDEAMAALIFAGTIESDDEFMAFVRAKDVPGDATEIEIIDA